MPANKEALFRYRVINRCLKDFRYTPLEKLIEACEQALYKRPISPRTIRQDLKEMKEDERLGYHAPIRYDKTRQGYYYEDPDYSLDNIPLNEEEVKALSFAATMLDQFREIGIFSTFSGAVQKIVDAVNIRRLSDEEDLFPFIEFEQSPWSMGHEHIDPIIRAIRDKQVIRFGYQRFDAKKSYTHEVHPYLLKQYRNRWYLIGWNHRMKEIFTYSLDRFSTSPETTFLPYHDIAINTRERYKSVIGIIVPEEPPEKIVLKFTLPQAWYVITQPIHASQQVKMKKDHAMVELTVAPTYELIQLIMSWGPDVEVAEPKKLREEIRQRHALSIREG